MKSFLLILNFFAITHGIEIICRYGDKEFRVAGQPFKCDVFRASTCVKYGSKSEWPRCTLDQIEDIPKPLKNVCPNLIALNFTKCQVTKVSSGESFLILESGRILEEFNEDWLPRHLDLTAVGFFPNKEKSFNERINENFIEMEKIYLNGKVCIRQIANDASENLIFKEILDKKCSRVEL